MALLDMSDRPAWYVVEIISKSWGPTGYLGIKYKWSEQRYLGNLAALRYASEVKPDHTKASGVQTFYETRLWQWDGRQWRKVI
jgi:hypothetical protein